MQISTSNRFGKTAAFILVSSLILTGCNNPFKSGKSNRLKSEVEGLQMVIENREKEIVDLKGENARLRVKAGLSPIDINEERGDGDKGDGVKPKNIDPNDTGSKPSGSKPATNGTVDYNMNGTYGVHIASYRLKENALIGWKKAREKHPDLYKSAMAKLMQLNLPSLSGTYYRLKIGPFSTAGEASYLCAQLEKRGEFCKVTPFDGDRLN